MHYNEENKKIIFDTPLKKEAHDGKSVYTGHQDTLKITINQKSLDEINQELTDKYKCLMGNLGLILGMMVGHESSSEIPLIQGTLASLAITGNIYALDVSNKAHAFDVYAPSGYMKIEDEATGNRLEIKDTFIKPEQGGPLVDAILYQPDGKKFVHAYYPVDLSEEKFKDLQALVKGQKTTKDLGFVEKVVCQVPNYVIQSNRFQKS